MQYKYSERRKTVECIAVWTLVLELMAAFNMQSYWEGH